MLTVAYLSLSAPAISVYLVFALAFFVLSRVHPNLVEPRWWALSAVAGALGMVGVSLRGTLHPFLSIGFANTALVACNLFSWMGVHGFIGHPLPVRRMALGLALLLAANVFGFAVWDSVALRTSLFCFANAGIGVLGLRDLKDYAPAMPSGISRAIGWITSFEVLFLFGAGGMAWFLPDAASSNPTRMHVLLPIALTWMTIDFLVRKLAYILLMTRRLRLQAEQANRDQLESEASAGRLIEHMSAGVLVIRPDQTLHSVNAAARRFLEWNATGMTSAEDANPSLFNREVLREDGSLMPRSQTPFDTVVASGLPVTEQIVGLRGGKSGKVRWALCSAYPVFFGSGELRHVVLTFTEITTLRQAQKQQLNLEQQLAQSQKMEALGTLAGGIAHDFNNILASISGNAHLAREDLVSGSPTWTSVDEIIFASRRGRELVSQIQAFNRKQPMQRLPLSMNNCVKEACNLLRVALPPYVELVHRFAPGQASLLGDATRIQQVLVNLGTNAIHALEGRSGRVTFSVETIPYRDARVPSGLSLVRDGVVNVVVNDTGCGMDDATRERIFEPFFTTKEVGRGTGLGLSVVAGMVDAHGGFIEVTSQLNVGTTFSIFFPALPDNLLSVTEGLAFTDVGSTTKAPETSPRGKAIYHVLYLDDDKALVSLIRRLLERHGYRVTTFSNQAEAIEAVRAQPYGFDVVLTDYTMPGLSGIDVARAVLQINPNLPVALTSAFITDDMCADAKASGVREVVFKTTAVSGFCDLVERLVQPEARSMVLGAVGVSGLGEPLLRTG